jgi:hypothetical protein
MRHWPEDDYQCGYLAGILCANTLDTVFSQGDSKADDPTGRRSS